MLEDLERLLKEQLESPEVKKAIRDQHVQQHLGAYAQVMLDLTRTALPYALATHGDSDGGHAAAARAVGIAEQVIEILNAKAQQKIKELALLTAEQRGGTQ